MKRMNGSRFEFEQFSRSRNRWVQFTPPEGWRCGPMAPSKETIPAIWVAPLEGGHGVTFEEAYREIGQPRRFDAVGGSGCVKCRRREEQMSHKQMSGDLHQVQEQVWHGNVNNTVEEFLGELSIEEAVDEFIAAYSEHWEPMPIYELKMTGSTYTLREVLVGYLERMTG